MSGLARPSWTASDVARRLMTSSSAGTSFTHWISRSPSTASRLDTAANITRDIAVGHYKPIAAWRTLSERLPRVRAASRRPHRRRRQTGGVPYQDQSNISAGGPGGDGVRLPRQHWFIPVPRPIQRRDRIVRARRRFLQKLRAVHPPARRATRPSSWTSSRARTAVVIPPDSAWRLLDRISTGSIWSEAAERMLAAGSSQPDRDIARGCEGDETPTSSSRSAVGRRSSRPPGDSARMLAENVHALPVHHDLHLAATHGGVSAE